MNKIPTYLITLLLLLGCVNNHDTTKTKLVVGIVVDQMRMDYVYRFQDHFTAHGFMRFYTEGFVANNHHFDYAQTKTGPGHASIATGTPPAVHGIIGNSWFDRQTGSFKYCVNDASFLGIGTQSKKGKKAPTSLLVSTFADENRLATQMRGKSISVSIKDRSAILSIGHTANGAYWFSGKDEGNFVTSNFYMDSLPDWAKTFNSSRKIDDYLTTWDTYYPIDAYAETGPDNSPYERLINGKDTPTFPYDLKALALNNGGYDVLESTPYGNSLVTDFAIEALKGEALGADTYADVMMVCYSSTDYIGHAFGTNAKELQDTYVRLDLELARLFETLDREVGKGQYTVFLTADHGVAPVPNYLTDNKIPAGYIHEKELVEALKKGVQDQYGVANLIRNVSNNEVYLDHKKIAAAKLDSGRVSHFIASFIQSQEGIAAAYPTATLMKMNEDNPLIQRLQRGYHPKRSGDITYVLLPGYMNYRKYGTTHGSAFVYDTHVPLLLFGKGVKKGETFKRTNITDIAPTISALLEISNPTGTIGNPIGEVLERR